MDPRQIIRLAVTAEEYRVSGHAYEEADKDGISLEMIERVMCYGMVRKIERLYGASRYTLRSGMIMVVVELSDDEVVVITAGRER